MPDLARRQIFIADDDTLIRDTLYMMFRRSGYDVRCFADGASLVEAARREPPACILLDVNMPGASGLDVLRDLSAHQVNRPVIMISGVADIPTAVDAIKSGADDFIEKPFERLHVVQRVADAITAFESRSPRPLAGHDFAGKERLTPRESEVLAAVVSGASNKQVGRALGISPRTIEVHRSRILEKVGAKNSVELVRIVLGAH
jgi:two-component system response regulator FixJ